MRSFLLTVIAAVCVGGVRAADLAPESMAGMVYIETTLLMGAATVNTVHLGDDAQFTGIMTEFGGRASLRQVTSPPGDGRFEYAKTSPASGRLTLRYSTGSTITEVLEFGAVNRGTIRPPPGSLFERSFIIRPAVPAAPLRNVAVRTRITAGQATVVGFSIPPLSNPNAEYYHVLIRVVGPTLRDFRVENSWATPRFAVYSGSSLAFTNQGASTTWNATTPEGRGYAKLFGLVGAFPLPTSSNDVVAVKTLPPGNYTIVCTPDTPTDAGGDALVEVYVLP